jgi:hypothetical protein
MGEIDTQVIKDEKIDGLSYRIDLEVDYDCKPDKFGLYPESCYTQAQLDAWKRGEWRYVDVIVTPVIRGVILEDFSDSLWGVEYGDYPITDEEDNVIETKDLSMDELISVHPVPDMISEVQSQLLKKLGGLVDALRAISSALNEQL